MTNSRAVLPGSDRLPAPAATVVGPLDPATEITVTIVLRRRAEPDAAAFATAPLSRAELAERYGAEPAEVDTVRQAVEAAGAQVESADAATRLVKVRGTAAVVGELFGASLEQVRRPDGTTGRQRTGVLTVPAALADRVEAVLGFDDRPQANYRVRIAPTAAVSASYTPLQLAVAYSMPDADGSNQTIAIIELDGGFTQADLDAYFGGLGLDTPSVSAVGVDGASNQPIGDPNSADAEVLLDIEVAGAIAPKAAQYVYFAPNTDAGFLDAVTQAAHATPTPTAMSISWGQSEDQWTAQSRTAMDQAFADAVLLGVSVTAAAGDDGSADNQASGVHADFPASSPHTLGCGGTTLELDSSDKVVSEVVWNDGGQGGATGGGVSDQFPLPDYQTDAGVPVRSGSDTTGRGVPDIAAVADPQTGYQVIIDGTSTVIGGTSAVAPLWAGLICRLAQLAGKSFGQLHALFYAGATPTATSAGFRDITEGNNGAYSADAGWDACTGLGVPNGAQLLQVVQG